MSAILNRDVKTMRLSLAAALACSLALSWSASAGLSQTKPAPGITAKAVWSPSSSEISEIRRKCSEGGPAQHETCLLDSMKAAGASAEAVAFVKEFAPEHGLAYVRGFRDTGRVSIAYIEYLFRANDLDGVLLVNGTPPFIDVDEKFIFREDLRKNADYATLLKNYPNASVFPADRYHERAEEAAGGNGRQSFQIEYLILNGCHACASIGTLLASFEFDESGHFDGVRALKVRPGGEADADRPVLSRRPDDGSPENAKEGKLDAMEIHSKPGSSFTIVLAANHTTGYSWRLAKAPRADLLRKVNDVYEEDSSGRVGAGGKEMWTFEALGTGTTDIEFEYARPFEKDAAPVNTAKFHIIIE